MTRYYTCDNVFCKYYKVLALYVSPDHEPDSPTCTLCDTVHIKVDEDEVYNKVLQNKN
jgi:hypothetical protein